MGGKLWNEEEELVLWTIIIPLSPRRLPPDQATEALSWEDCAILMRDTMRQRRIARGEPEQPDRRNYTYLGLFEHLYQNAVKVGTSRYARKYAAEYRARAAELGIDLTVNGFKPPGSNARLSARTTRRKRVSAATKKREAAGNRAESADSQATVDAPENSSAPVVPTPGWFSSPVARPPTSDGNAYITGPANGYIPAPINANAYSSAPGNGYSAPVTAHPSGSFAGHPPGSGTLYTPYHSAPPGNQYAAHPGDAYSSAPGNAYAPYYPGNAYGFAPAGRGHGSDWASTADQPAARLPGPGTLQQPANMGSSDTPGSDQQTRTTPEERSASESLLSMRQQDFAPGFLARRVAAVATAERAPTLGLEQWRGVRGHPVSNDRGGSSGSRPCHLHFSGLPSVPSLASQRQSPQPAPAAPMVAALSSSSPARTTESGTTASLPADSSAPGATARSGSESPLFVSQGSFDGEGN
ncbi:hypothetical protein B0T16DRAFT_387102 [Cercophora newfieldiana]|uniref:Uncharacterized protein n=1 Tax=Cercophora newfieldiana TaxID=92897 RepID=A0AA39YFJ7_9PEZI|nr:hypothetical protein B0T16DRAFT_387102 [Cercophora newfieldiana]